MKQTDVLQNLFITDALVHLRNKDTATPTFRYYSDRICQLLLSKTLTATDAKTVHIQTPLMPTIGEQLNDDFVIVIILRAGLAMLQPALTLLPSSKIGFAGILRNEATAMPEEYYWKMPTISETTSVFITDPMLATGGTGLHVVRKIATLKPKDIRYVSVIATNEGIETMHAEFPEVSICTAAIDPELNSQKFIVPGLGDYGDRYFGT